VRIGGCRLYSSNANYHGGVGVMTVVVVAWLFDECKFSGDIAVDENRRDKTFIHPICVRVLVVF